MANDRRAFVAGGIGFHSQSFAKLPDEAWLLHRVIDWPYSSFHRYLAQGIYSERWCGDMSEKVDGDG